MSIKWVLTAISVLIFVVPICGALIDYQNDLAALVMPETPESLTQPSPNMEYVGYQITDPLKPPLLKFRIYNSYSVNLRLDSIGAEVFCSDHGTFLGFANGTGVVDIPAKSSEVIGLTLTLTSEGEAHIYHNHLGGDFYIDLRSLALNVQGIKIRYREQISRIGPIRIPSS
jgi:hypothetical protein